MPHWGFKRGIQYEDDLYLPTKENPLTDGVSGATPRKGFELNIHLPENLEEFVIKLEINHSTDFNEFYPKTANKGEPEYSGGKEGSGQPALVYAAYINRNSGQNQFEAHVIGHSSPDGTDGAVNADLSTLTTAMHIVKRMVITLF